MNRRCLLALGLVCILCPSLGHAQALRFQPQGAAATGQGNAFIAQADDASAIHYNPAGLSQVNGVQVVTGTNLVGGSIKFNSPTGSSASTGSVSEHAAIRVIITNTFALILGVLCNRHASGLIRCVLTERCRIDIIESTQIADPASDAVADMH